MTQPKLFSKGLKKSDYTQSQLRTVWSFVLEKSTQEIAEYLGVNSWDVILMKMRLMRLNKLKIEKSAYVKLPWESKKKWWKRK